MSPVTDPYVDARFFRRRKATTPHGTAMRAMSRPSTGMKQLNRPK
jgi:hypothetical protein